MKKYILGFITALVLFSLYAYNVEDRIHEISAKLPIGTAYLKDTLTGDLISSRNFYPKDSIIFNNSGNFGINSKNGGSQILFNESNNSIDFGERDVRVNGNYGFTSLGGATFGLSTLMETAIVSKRLKTAKGSNVASATTITAGEGNFFAITGTTNIDQLTVTSWITGSIVILRFDDVLTLKNKSGNSGQFELAGAVDFVTSAGDVILLVLDGTTWCEISRSLN